MYRQTILAAKATLRLALAHEGLTPSAIATILTRHGAIEEALTAYRAALDQRDLRHTEAVCGRMFWQSANASFKVAPEEMAYVLLWHARGLLGKPPCGADDAVMRTTLDAERVTCARCRALAHVTAAISAQ